MKKYYSKRTNGKSNETWTEKCSKAFSGSGRDETGEFLRGIDFLKK